MEACKRKSHVEPELGFERVRVAVSGTSVPVPASGPDCSLGEGEVSSRVCVRVQTSYNMRGAQAKGVRAILQENAVDPPGFGNRTLMTSIGDTRCMWFGGNERG